MTIKTAEIIAIGDELISGQRLDTNSQWISSRLSEMGLEPSFHTCVGDSLEDGIEVFTRATQRCDVIVCTGGIGPTKDDLTRNVVSNVAGVDLESRPEIEDHIRSIFASYGREMPENNKIQACFPVGSNVIPNSEGTAPGIDVVAGSCRIFALPGVPYEMKEMWANYVQPKLLAVDSNPKTIMHHVVHCFGCGESQTELMLEGMTDRDHVPRVGITASKATISLRITAIGKNEDVCNELVSPTVATIKEKLGTLVFGENGVELAEVVVDLLNEAGQTLSVLDFGFGGAAALELFKADPRHSVLTNSQVQTHQAWRSEESIEELAQRLVRQNEPHMAVVISPIRKMEEGRVYDIAIATGTHVHVVTQKYAGHSGLIEARTIKQILNQIRLFMIGNAE